MNNDLYKKLVEKIFSINCNTKYSGVILGELIATKMPHSNHRLCTIKNTKTREVLSIYFCLSIDNSLLKLLSFDYKGLGKSKVTSFTRDFMSEENFLKDVKLLIPKQFFEAVTNTIEKKIGKEIEKPIKKEEKVNQPVELKEPIQEKDSVKEADKKTDTKRSSSSKREKRTFKDN